MEKGDTPPAPLATAPHVEAKAEVNPTTPAPPGDPAAVMAELTEIKTKINAIAAKKESSFGFTLLKIVGAVLLAGFTGWWSSYLTRQDAGKNRLHERINEHAGDAYFEARSLVDGVNTDLESFCLNSKQDSKESDERAKKLRILIDSGPFTEHVDRTLRAFNNYAQDQMARRAGAELSVAEQVKIRRDAHQLRAEAMAALQAWAGD